MKIYRVVRPDDVVLVSIFKNKSDNTYSFINFTREHICKCRFKTEQEALKDMENQKENGKILFWNEI